MIEGDLVRINYPIMPYHGKTARVVEMMGRVDSNGFDLGELAAVRLADGVEVALRLDALRVVERRPNATQPTLPGFAA